MVSENVRDIYNYLRHLEKQQPVKEDSLKVGFLSVKFVFPDSELKGILLISGLQCYSKDEGCSHQLVDGGSSTIQLVTGEKSVNLVEY
jgi:hypothetical protein